MEHWQVRNGLAWVSFRFFCGAEGDPLSKCECPRCVRFGLPPLRRSQQCFSTGSYCGTDSAPLLTWNQVQIEAQKQDARERIIVWDAEKIGRFDSLDEDAEFEDDPDFQQGALLSSGISHGEWAPMGTRNEEGVIMPFSVEPPELGLVERIADTDTSGATQELLFTGRSERVPDCVQHLVSLGDSPIPFMS